MFQMISHMYRHIRKQETVQALMLIQCLCVNFDSTKAEVTSPATPIISMTLQPTMPLERTTLTTVPEDFKDIQTWPSQVWICDKIRFDPNGSWIKLVCTYKFSTGDRVWMTHTRERDLPYG